MTSIDNLIHQGTRGQLGIFEYVDLRQQIPISQFSDKGPIIGKVFQQQYDGNLPKVCKYGPSKLNVLSLNSGGERGVLPYKGLSKRIIPYQENSKNQGVYPQAIQTRGQPRSLYYDSRRIVDLPLMPIADNFNSGLNSRIPQAPYKVY